ncbi:MAG TPA: response regulator [Sediminibacterium sp.]|nr:response regulator [Sediminibacterium sp.]
MFTDNMLMNTGVDHRALLDAVFNKLPDFIFVFDTREKKFVVFNPALEHQLKKCGIVPVDFNCVALKTIIHPDDFQEVQHALKSAMLLQGNDFVEFEVRCKNELKLYQYFNTKISVFEREGDEVVYLLGISQNITDRKNNEVQREVYKNRLQELSFITSHEMRHEYAKIQSIINLMDNRFITDTERSDLIAEAKKSIQIINSSIFKLNHKLSFNQNDDFFDLNNEGEKYSKIVFVDDDVLTNVLNKKIVQALLPEMPVEVFLDIDDALASLQKNTGDKGTLIFLDINFPGRGGWEFLDEYAGFSSAANVIVLSSSIDNRDREKARGYKSVIDYITKPLSFDFIKTFFEQLQTAKA